MFRTLLQTKQVAFCLDVGLSGSGSVSSSGAVGLLRDLVLALSSKSEALRDERNYHEDIQDVFLNWSPPKFSKYKIPC